MLSVMRLSLPLVGVLLAASLGGCTSSAPAPAASAPPPVSAPVVVAPVVAAPAASVVSTEPAPLDELARVHGTADPWSVAGYRMGQRALSLLGLPRQSDDLEVVHRGPLVPNYAAVADGASVATGASLGKVNLRLEEADVASVLTVYRRKSTGQTLALRPTEAFKQRFLNVPREQLRAAGGQVFALRDDEIFEIAPAEAPAVASTLVTPPASPVTAPAATSGKAGDVRDPWVSQPARDKGQVRNPPAPRRRPGQGNWY